MFYLFKLLFTICRPARVLRWAIFLSVVTVTWLLVENSALQAYLSEYNRRNTYREEVKRLQEQQQQLVAELADLKDGGFWLEKAVRERWKWVKPGEKVLYIETPDQEKQDGKTPGAVVPLMTPAEAGAVAAAHSTPTPAATDKPAAPEKKTRRAAVNPDPAATESSAPAAPSSEEQPSAKASSKTKKTGKTKKRTAQ